MGKKYIKKRKKSDEKMRSQARQGVTLEKLLKLPIGKKGLIALKCTIQLEAVSFSLRLESDG